jgi:DNA invertase Pin-like site-specific DNA recombinase
VGRKQPHSERLFDTLGKPGPGTSAAGYVRYSSDLQKAATITTQKRFIQEYAESNGWHIVHWYEEAESSAKYEEIEKRPIFAQLLEDAGRQFQAVVCYMNDRWARNTAVAFASLEELRHRRTWWATADGLWDIDKVEEDGSDIAFAIDTQFNAAFARRLSKRAIDAKEDRARDGYHNGSVPFGYLPPEYPKAPDGAPSTWKPPRMPVRVDPVNFPALVRLGELAAQGWADAAIADELSGFVSTTPRFGQRPLSKDTVAAMRRMWFPREFAPGCGHGTIETPSGDLVEGRHSAAWPYELWQRMVEVKTSQYRRPRGEAHYPSDESRHVYEFSRMIVCQSCRRTLRVNSDDRHTYYRDTSYIRKLPCSAFGSLSVRASDVVNQFGDLLAAIRLPDNWRDVVADHCRQITYDANLDYAQTRRADLEAQQKRFIEIFTKGYITEHDLDTQIDRIRSEMQTLPPSSFRSADACIEAAIFAGETLIDMASYWEEALPEERRDIVWALLQLSGLRYDLERRAIVELVAKPDMLYVLTLGLSAQWEQHGEELRLCAEFLPRKLERSEMAFRPYQRKLNPAECEAARGLVANGKSLRQVAAHFHVSRMAIWRIIDAQARHGGSR